MSCRSPNIFRAIILRRMRWAGHVARMGDRRGAYRDLVGRPDVKRPRRRPRLIWEDDIKMDLWEMRSRGMVWIDLDQNNERWLTPVNAKMNLRVPLNVRNFLISSGTANMSLRTLFHEVSYIQQRLLTRGFKSVWKFKIGKIANK